jgi:hypothetical protein
VDKRQKTTDDALISPDNLLTNITVAGAWKTDFVPDGLGRLRIELDYGWQNEVNGNQ